MGVFVLLAGSAAVPDLARASDPTLPSIPGLQLWLKADAITGLSDGAAVATWPDSSALDRDATQTETAKRPVFKAGVANGKPVVRFDGVNDVLMTTLSAAQKPVTVFALVYLPTTLSSTGTPVGGSVHGGLQIQVPPPLDPAMGAGGFNVNRQQYSLIAKGSRPMSLGAHVLAVSYDASGQIRLVLDGETIASGRKQTSFVGGNVWIGGNGSNGEFFSRDIGEVLVYDSALSKVDRHSVEAYLRARWASPAAPAADNAVLEPDGLTGWFKTESLEALANGAQISSWPDSSGVTSAAIQSTPDYRPVLRKPGVAGNPLLRFDGGNDYLTTTVSSAQKPSTLVALVHFGTALTQPGAVLGSNGNEGLELQIGGGSLDPGKGAGNFNLVKQSIIPLAIGRREIPKRAHILAATFGSNGEAKLYLDGDYAGSATQNVSLLPGRLFWIGGAENNEFFSRDIGEIAIYDRVLSAAEMSTVTDYLTAKWGAYFFPLSQTRGTPGGGDGLAKNPTGFHADPVNTATGSFVSETSDLELPGVGVPFGFKRTYNSGDARVGRLGRGWSDSLDWRTSLSPAGDAVVRAGDGQEIQFTKQADGSFSGNGATTATFAATGTSGHELVTAEQIHYVFDAQGRLVAVKDRNGEGMTLAYDANGLSTVTDGAGRIINVTVTNGRITAVTLPGGAGSVAFAYTNGLLTAVTDVGGGVTEYSYDAGDRLATIVDQNDVTTLTNTYDSTTGRVVDQMDALGNHTTFAWDEDTQVSTVTDPNGNVWKDYYANNVLLKQEPPAGQTTAYARDADLNPIGVAGATGEQTLMTYDARGNVLSATAPASLGSATKTMSYDTHNNLTTVVDARGTVTSYGYDGDGNNTSVTQDGQTVATYTYDDAGRVLTSTDGRGNSTGYTYDANGNRASVTDPLGNKTTYAYDAAGRMTSRVDPLGNVTGANPLDFTWTWTYDAAGRTLTESDPLGNTTAYTYDDAGNKLTETDARNKTTTYAYNAANQLVSVTAPDGGVTTYTYDASGNKLTETNPRNHTTTYAYDANNRLTSTTTPLGNKTTYFYDADGNQTKVAEPRGNVSGANPDDYATTSTYDAAGRLLTETNPLGQTTTYTYDKVGNQLTVTDPRGKVTTNTHDGRNRLVSVTAPDGGITTYTYDANGNQLTRTDPRGKVWTNTYDLANRLSSSTTPLGNKTTYFYDANGRQTKIVEPRGNVSGANPDDYATVSTYDRVGRLLTTTDPLGNQTSYSYDAVGNKLSVTDAANKTTGYTYDPVNRLASVIAGDLTTTSYTYDLAGNLTSRTDANNHTTTYVFDADNRRTTVTSPIGQTWTTGYDAAGNVTETVDANGNSTPTAGDGTTTSSYDRAGRLTEIDYSDSTPDVSFAYDAAGNRTTMTDGAGTETRTYDDVNRVTTVTRGTDTFSYVYDLAGNLTRRTYPDSTITDYSFDEDSRMATVTSGGATTTYAYDPAGNQTATTLPASNGHIETRTYDRAGRLTGIGSVNAGTTLVHFDYTLDAVGNPTQVVRSGSLPGTTTYNYDDLHRLSEVCYATGCAGATDYIRWTYDAVGNRLTETRASSTTSYTYNPADQLTLAGATSYAYDANGNQIVAGSRTFTYDLANRMTSSTSAGTTTSYAYDGSDNRFQEVAGGQTVSYAWDPNHSLPQLALERDAGNTLIRRYLYGNRQVSMSTLSATSYYHVDHLGSVANITSMSGATEWTYSYEPFGISRTEIANGQPSANVHKFAGELQQPLGLYHLRARDYDPTIGIFTRIDPAEPSLREPYATAYAYVANRPTVMVDPSGRTSVPSRAAQLAVARVTTAIEKRDECTSVPDEIVLGISRLKIGFGNFRRPCSIHDICYGSWREKRKGCDDRFYVNMLSECDIQFSGWRESVIKHVVIDRKGKCRGVARLYYWGVWQFGGYSWEMKAHRYSAAAVDGCPYLDRYAGTHHGRCLAHVIRMSYPPYYRKPGEAKVDITKMIACVVARDPDRCWVR